jgi:hypothetical protein
MCTYGSGEDFKRFSFFQSNSLPVWKIFQISEPCEQILKQPFQVTFLQTTSFLGVVVSGKMFKEKLKPDMYEMS